MLALKDHWVWDSWFLKENSVWHCWFLMAPKTIGDPTLRHWNVKQGHATSNDLIHWEFHGTSLEPSEPTAWDDKTTWTGSTLRGDDNLWHYFYTGTSQAENAMVQRIGHATSNDLKHWQRVGSGLCLDLLGDNAHHYETNWEGRWHDRAMRDPWVMKDPDSDEWLMFFTARASDVEETNAAGCIGLATSTNLYDWQLQAPIFTGGWGQLEVPQVFQYGAYWYCLFCMDPAHQSKANIDTNGVIGRGNHYLMGDSARGPWRLPQGQALDTEVERYAARIVNHNGLKIIGFKDGEPHDFGGYLMDPSPVKQQADGSLTL